MAAGLPGAGIGGIFYLLSALAMPICELYHTVRGDRATRWKLAWQQSSLALGILAGLWITGWALGHLLRAAARVVPALGATPAQLAGSNAFRVSALAVSLTTLAVV